MIRSSVFVMTILSACSAFGQSTAFTYQGRLESEGIPANGNYDLRFRLFDAAAAGVQVGPTLCINDVEVVNGLFTLKLDFGPQFANPGERHVEIDVRVDTGFNCSNAGGFVVLAPRQEVTPVPKATHANSAFALDAPDGAPLSALLVDNDGDVGIGTNAPTARLDVKGDGDTSPEFGTPIARFSRGNGNNFIAMFADIGGNYIVADDPTDNQKPLRLQTRNNKNILLEPHGTGRVGIGTANPSTPLHLRSDDPVFVLQDPGPTSDQSGYVGFWNAAFAETAWVGFGTPGSAQFSIVNARSGGNIALYPGAGSNVDIHGDVKIGPGSQFFAASSEENLRIVRGSIIENGPIQGSGFSATNPLPGRYTVSFATPFATPPTVTATVGAINNTIDAFVQVVEVSTSEVRLLATTQLGIPTDRDIYFIAIGPR